MVGEAEVVARRVERVEEGKVFIQFFMNWKILYFLRLSITNDFDIGRYSFRRGRSRPMTLRRPHLVRR